MSENLLTMVQGSLGGGALSKIAGLLGQSPGTTESAIGSVTPVLLGGLARKADDPRGADELSASLDQVDDHILDDVPRFYSGSTESIASMGSGMLGGIFGNHESNVVTDLSNSSGLSGLGRDGTHRLMALIAPITMANLARYKRRHGLNAAGLSHYLTEQRHHFGPHIPVGLGEPFGFKRVEVSRTVYEREEPAQAAPSEPLYEEPPHRGGARWLLPLLAIGALAFIAFALLRERDKTKEPVSVMYPEVQGVEKVEKQRERQEAARTEAEEERTGRLAVEDFAATGRESEEELSVTERKATEGEAARRPEVERRGGEVGAETGTQRGAVEWKEGAKPLYLERLFSSGSGDLSAGTSDDLESLAQLIADNPEKQVEIRGYSFGADTARTRGLGLERAQAVVDWLSEHGVDEDRLTAVSGGPSSQNQIEVFFE